MKKLTIILAVLFITGNSFSQQTDWSNVESVFGKKGNVQDNVFKITFPRSDLNVKIGDFAIAPGLAFTSWIGFMKMGNQTMMMGDMVLLDKEVGPVITKLINENLQITALHNHVVNEVPAIKYIHFSGEGDAADLAGKIKSVFSITGTPLTAPAVQQQSANPDWSKVEAILGTSGKKNGNLLQYGFPRNEKLTEGGMEMPAYMGRDVTSEMKALIDRTGYVSRANGRMFRKKVGASVVAVRRSGAIHTLDTMDHFFLSGEMVIVGRALAIGRAKGEVEKGRRGDGTREIARAADGMGARKTARVTGVTVGKSGEAGYDNRSRFGRAP